jgi:general secretion pathway protein K
MSRQTSFFGSQRGSVAILALWGVAIIFILLAAAGFTTRTEILIARHAVAASRARNAAEAGTQLGIKRLLEGRAAGTAIFDGRKLRWRDGSTQVEIAIRDEAGKVDINQAPLELLAGLFSAIGRPDEEALLLACRILVRRGSGDDGCPDLSDSDPQTAASARLFAAPEELAALPGFDQRLFAAIADAITVETGATAVDPTVAPRLVLLAIPGATQQMVDDYLADRAKAADSLLPSDQQELLAASPFFMRSPERDFTVSAVATTEDGARYRADLLVRLTDNRGRPYTIRGWRMPPIAAR